MAPITTIRQFRSAVRKGFRAQDKGVQIEWEWSRRVTFPTGAPGITGEGALSNGTHFLAVCRLTPHGHHLTVTLHILS